MSIVNYLVPLQLGMKAKRINIQELGVNIDYTVFAPEGKLEEIHALLHVTDLESDFETQYRQLLQAQQQFIEQIGGATIMMKRYFVSDATNQMPLMCDLAEHVSVIQQPPLDGTKVAAWLYMHRGESNYQQVWKMNQIVPEGDSYHQSRTLLERYEEELKQRYDANIAEHCVRTWFFVRDVDTQYKGLVVARRENFAEQGLTNKTHYLASTGIHGIPADTNAIVQMDTYMVKGLEPDQQQYLYARTHLNPTYEYGVTFERGVKITYGDRTHLLISGTASINNKGEVVHVGNIRKQAQRMWENVEALLNEGGASFDDVMQIIVYLRDTADYTIVEQLFAKKFPNTPYVITYAPVCRPQWLIEMECIAVTNSKDEHFKDY